MKCCCGYLSEAKCRWFAYGVADATDTAPSLALLKSRMGYLYGASLPRLSWSLKSVYYTIQTKMFLKIIKTYQLEILFDV